MLFLKGVFYGISSNIKIRTDLSGMPNLFQASGSGECFPLYYGNTFTCLFNSENLDVGLE